MLRRNHPTFDVYAQKKCICLSPDMKSLTYKRAAVNVQILYLRMASGKNCLDFQIPAVHQLCHKEKSISATLKTVHTLSSTSVHMHVL